MYKNVIILLSGIFIVLLLSSCSMSNDFSKNSRQTIAEPVPAENYTQEDQRKEETKQEIELTKRQDISKRQVGRMTLDEKIGQLLFVGIDGYSLNQYSRNMIEKYHVGGIILFKNNIETVSQTLSLTNSLKELNSKSKYPLFIGVDEEGGRVSRLPSEFIKAPSSGVIGRINNDELSYKLGKLIGQELRAIGANIDFAPVLDINSNPNNPVIGDRSFGANADIVTRLGIQTMKGLQSQDIISTVKHFPGHGDTSVDSHIGLPRVNNDLNRLNGFELIPFKEAIKNDADMIMAAHILLPKIDPVNPATLSEVIINEILRKNMGFGGVVITDDMTMGAISNNHGIGEASVKALMSGCDIVLVCHDYNKQIQAFNEIKKAVEDGIIPIEEIDEKVYRVLKLKRKYNLSDEKRPLADIESINREMTNLFKVN